MKTPPVFGGALDGDRRRGADRAGERGAGERRSQRAAFLVDARAGVPARGRRRGGWGAGGAVSPYSDAREGTAHGSDSGCACPGLCAGSILTGSLLTVCAAIFGFHLTGGACPRSVCAFLAGRGEPGLKRCAAGNRPVGAALLSYSAGRRGRFSLRFREVARGRNLCRL